MKALVIGATGATGQALLPLLIAAPAVERIDSFGRRAPDLTDAKLHSHIIDFHQPQQYSRQLFGTALRQAAAGRHPAQCARRPGRVSLGAPCWGDHRGGDR